MNQIVWWISEDKVRAAMKRMKSGKAVGPDDTTCGGLERFRRDGSGVLN